MRKSRSRVGVGRVRVGEGQSWGGEELGGVDIVWNVSFEISPWYVYVSFSMYVYIGGTYTGWYRIRVVSIDGIQ